MENEEWVVYRIDNDERVYCEPRADWDEWFHIRGYTEPPPELTLLAKGLTRQQAKQMVRLANGK
jgi:hypothetical protein